MTTSNVARLSASFELTGIPAAQQQLRSIDRAMSATGQTSSKSMQQVGKSTSGLSNLLGVGAKAAVGFGVGMIGVQTGLKAAELGFKGTVLAAAQYEKNLNVLRATSGATDAQMAQISATAKTLGSDTKLAGVSASDAAVSMLELSKSGLSVTDTMAAAKGVLQLATAGQISNGEAAAIAASQLNAFGLSGDNAVRVADLLAAAANASQTSVGQLGTGMAQASAVFANANYTVEDLVTSMALMSNRGIQGSDAATSLKTAVLRLQAPTGKAAELMETLGINVRDAQGNMLPFQQLVAHLTERFNVLGPAQRDAALATIFGTDAIRAAQVVFTAGADSVDAMNARVTESGAAARLAEAQTQGLSGTWNGLISNAETLGLTVGELATGPLTKLVEAASFVVGGLTNMLNAWMEFGDAVKEDPGIQKMVEHIQAFFGVLAGFGNAILNLATPVGKVSDLIDRVGDAWNNLPAPVKAFAIALSPTIALIDHYANSGNDAVDVNKQLADQWGGAATSAGKTYNDTLKNMTREGASAADKVNFLADEHQRLTAESLKAWQAVQKETEAFGGNTVAAQQNSEAFRTANANYVGVSQSLATVNSELAEVGFTATTTADGATVLSGKFKTMGSDASTSGANAAEMARQWDEELAKIQQAADDAYKSMRKLIDSPTGAELALNTTMAAGTAALKTYDAAFTTTGETRTRFLDQTQQMIDKFGLEGEALTRANTLIQQARDGTIAQADAVKEFTKIIEPNIEVLSKQADAHASIRDASGASAEEQVANAQGVAQSSEQAAERIQSSADEVVGHYDTMAKGAEGAAQETNQSLGTIGGKEVIGPIQDNVTELGNSLGADLPAKAESAVTDTNAAFGEMLGPPAQQSVESNADAIGNVISPAITPGAEEAVTAVDQIVGNMLTGGSVSQVTTNAKAISDNIKREIGATNLTPETEAMINTLAMGIASGTPAVTGNVDLIMSAIISIINGGSGAASSAGANFANAFAMAILSGASNVASAAQTLASTAATNLGGTLGIHSPSKVGIYYGEMTAEGVAVGILGGTGVVVRSIQILSHDALALLETAVDQFNATWADGSAGADAYAHDIENLGQTFDNLASGKVGRIAEDLSLINDAFDVFIGQSHTVITSLRQASIDTANLDVALAHLNAELSYTDPYSERAEAIKKDIETLEAWKGQIQSGIDILEAEAKAVEASKTAWDGYVRTREKLDQQAFGNQTFGADATGVLDSLKTVFEEGTAVAGDAATEAVHAYLEGMRGQMGEQFPAFSEQVWALFGQAISAPTPEAREAAMVGLRGMFAGAQTEAQLAGTLSAQTFATALSNAQMDRQLQETVGSDFASFFDQLQVTVKEGGEDNIAELGVMVDGIHEKLKTLPEFIQGQLGTQWSQAWDQFMAEPSNPANIARLQEAARRIHQATEVIPDNFEKLTPQMKAAVMQVFSQVDQGVITIEQAQERISRVTDLIPEDFAKLAPALQAEIQAIIDSFLSMGVSAEQAADMIDAAMKRAADSAAATAARLKNAAAVVSPGGQFTPVSGGSGRGPSSLGYQYASAASYIATLTPEAAGGFMNWMNDNGLVWYPGIGPAHVIKEPDGSQTIEPVQMAQGGTIKGGWFTVGEQGFELAHLGPNGLEVFPHDQSQQMLGRSAIPGYAGGTNSGGIPASGAYAASPPIVVGRPSKIGGSADYVIGYGEGHGPSYAELISPTDLGGGEGQNMGRSVRFSSAYNKMMNLYARADAMGLGAEAWDIVSRAVSGSMSASAAVTALESLIKSGGKGKSFVAGIAGVKGNWDNAMTNAPNTVNFGRSFDAGGIAYTNVSGMLHGTQTDPEIVAPLSKLPGLISNAYSNQDTESFDKMYDCLAEIRKMLAMNLQRQGNQTIMVDRRVLGEVVEDHIGKYMLRRGFSG